MRITKKLDKVVDKYLEIWYLVLNREIFNNKLPRKLPVRSMRERGLRGYTQYWVDPGKGSARTVCVGIDPRDYNPLEVLLHEMVHVWQAKVLKYKFPHKPMHDHVFWQKFKLSRRQLKDKINEIQKEL